MGYEGRMRGLEKNYESVLVELVAFQRGVAQQDGVVKSLIRCCLGENSESIFFLFQLWFFFFFPSPFLIRVRAVLSVVDCTPSEC
jgi:hypothetical protein